MTVATIMSSEHTQDHNDRRNPFILGTVLIVLTFMGFVIGLVYL